MKPGGGLEESPLYMKKISMSKIDFYAIWNQKNKKKSMWKIKRPSLTPPYYGIYLLNLLGFKFWKFNSILFSLSFLHLAFKEIKRLDRKIRKQASIFNFCYTKTLITKSQFSYPFNIPGLV